MSSSSRSKPPSPPRPEVAHSIVIVDDGSSDGREAIVAAREHHPVVRGFGSVATSARPRPSRSAPTPPPGRSSSRWTPTSRTTLPRSCASSTRWQPGPDLVSGWKRDRQDPLSKRLPSRLFNRITSMVSGVKLRDHNCGFKAGRREIYTRVPLRRAPPVHPGDGARHGLRGRRDGGPPPARCHGHSKFGFERYLRGLLDLFTVLVITRYGRRPGHFFGGIGIVAALVGFLILTYLTGVWVFTDKPDRQPPPAHPRGAAGGGGGAAPGRGDPRRADPPPHHPTAGPSGPRGRRPRGATCFVRATSAAPERCGGRRTEQGSRGGWPGGPAAVRSTSASLLAIYDVDAMLELDTLVDLPGDRSGRPLPGDRARRHGARLRVRGGGEHPLVGARSAEVHAVESDAGFAAHIDPVVRDAGATLHVVPGSPPPARGAVVQARPWRRGLRGVRRHDRRGGRPLRPGGDRRPGAEEALVRSLPHLAPGGLVLLDDAWRTRYRAALGRVPATEVTWLWGLRRACRTRPAPALARKRTDLLTGRSADRRRPTNSAGSTSLIEPVITTSARSSIAQWATR